MTTVNIIGTGNVAWHLAKAIQPLSQYELKTIAGRSKKGLASFTKLAHSCVLLDQLTAADITIIAVSDDAITEVSKTLSYNSGLFVHTSGSVDITALSGFKQYGVFYPLQSFSKEDQVDFKEIPMCIEAGSDKGITMLSTLGQALSKNVTTITSEQRRQLHLAAVFVNNFSNHCFTLGQELCEKHNLSFDLLKPLLHKTAQKAIMQDPAQSQTGPAKRNDYHTIASHLELLEDEAYKNIYTTLSKAITTYYGEKL